MPSDPWNAFDYVHQWTPWLGALVLGWIGWIQRAINRHEADIRVLQSQHDELKGIRADLLAQTVRMDERFDRLDRRLDDFNRRVSLPNGD